MERIVEWSAAADDDESGRALLVEQLGGQTGGLGVDPTGPYSVADDARGAGAHRDRVTGVQLGEVKQGTFASGGGVDVTVDDGRSCG